MIERPGITFVLSLIIFAVATVVLYRNPKLASAMEQAADFAAEAAERGSLPAGLTGDPQRGNNAQSLGVAAGMKHRQVEMESEAPELVSAPSVRPRAPLRSFTRAGKGETLESVAERVYGSSAFADELWRANRDQLPDRTMAPTESLVLRTPTI